jgi:hypothetical protein
LLPVYARDMHQVMQHSSLPAAAAVDAAAAAASLAGKDIGSPFTIPRAAPAKTTPAVERGALQRASLRKLPLALRAIMEKDSVLSAPVADSAAALQAERYLAAAVELMGAAGSVSPAPDHVLPVPSESRVQFKASRTPQAAAASVPAAAAGAAEAASDVRRQMLQRKSVRNSQLIQQQPPLDQQQQQQQQQRQDPSAACTPPSSALGLFRHAADHLLQRAQTAEKSSDSFKTAVKLAMVCHMFLIRRAHVTGCLQFEPVKSSRRLNTIVMDPTLNRCVQGLWRVRSHQPRLFHACGVQSHYQQRSRVAAH